MMRRPAPLLGALTLSVTLSGGAVGQSADHWRLVEPTALRVLARTNDRALAEASGLAASDANPGLYWTIEDSGNPPALLAIDSLGRLQASITVGGAANVDWESVAVGNCDTDRCVYIADTGDNRERRGEVTIYRLPEPRLTERGSQVSPTAQRLRVRYPDHPHDVEALGALPGGDLLLATKGRSGHVLLFTLPAHAWSAPQPVTATLLDTLPITPQVGQGRAITDLAVSPAANRLALRTYREIYMFDRDPDTGRVTPHQWLACNVLGQEPQGEGIAWGPGDWDFMLMSERGLFAGGTVIRLSCPTE